MQRFSAITEASNSDDTQLSRCGERILESTIRDIKRLVQKGGPTPQEYTSLNQAMDKLVLCRKSGVLSQQQFTKILHAFGNALSIETIQGFVFQKPHGYAGDFEVIERIYNYWTAPDPNLKNWDRFFHSHKAPQAVRNRVSYFLEQIWKMKNQFQMEARVLNVGSGPGRDLYETLKVIGPSNIVFDCIDQDRQAIQYAETLCKDFSDTVNFLHKNVLRFNPTEKYDLIWSAGLFDYFSDALFKRVIKRLLPGLKKNGKLVIGNFSDDNPTQGYMELFDWILIHRSKRKLLELAEACGVSPKNVWIEQEAEGVNLFLHILKT